MTSLFLLAAVAAPLAAQVRFEDDFEDDLAGWELVGDKGNNLGQFASGGFFARLEEE